MTESRPTSMPHDGLTEQRKCAQHGLYTATGIRISATRTHWAPCPECDECERAAERKRKEEAERVERELHQRELKGTCGVVGRYLTATLAGFVTTTQEQRAVREACETFVTDFRVDQGAGMLLLGPPGTGKTHLGAAMALEIITRYALSARLASAREIVRELRSTWRRDSSESEEDALERFTWYGLLLLDEVGAGFDSDSERAQLFEVIDQRYQRQRPTVVLSNLNSPQLRQAVGDRSFDRLREGARTLILSWPSYRGRAL